MHHPSPPKLWKIKPDLSPWNPLGLMRKQEVIVNRLRVGHTFATHNYLMNTTHHRTPPICPFCSNQTLTIEHVFTICDALAQSRMTHFGAASNLELKDLLGNELQADKLMNFLEFNNILELI